MHGKKYVKCDVTEPNGTHIFLRRVPFPRVQDWKRISSTKGRAPLIMNERPCLSSLACLYPQFFEIQLISKLCRKTEWGDGIALHMHLCRNGKDGRISPWFIFEGRNWKCYILLYKKLVFLALSLLYLPIIFLFRFFLLVTLALNTIGYQLRDTQDN